MTMLKSDIKRHLLCEAYTFVKNRKKKYTEDQKTKLYNAISKFVETGKKDECEELTEFVEYYNNKLNSTTNNV